MTPPTRFWLWRLTFVAAFGVAFAMLLNLKTWQLIVFGVGLVVAVCARAAMDGCRTEMLDREEP